MQVRGRTHRSKSTQEPNRRGWSQLRGWLIVILVLAVAITVFRLVRQSGSVTSISSVTLPCAADQDVRVFGDSVLYYDGASIHCLNASGGIRWDFPVGTGAQYHCSGGKLVVWSGTQLFIIDKNGRASYNENMGAPVQFARVCGHYAAAVVGDDTEPDLIIKNLDGTQVDTETEAFSGMMLLDCGFYGEADQYLWTLALDMYGTAINTVLNTFQVGKMNTGVVDLGQFLAYRVLFEDSKLRVFTTQQMYTYDYKAVQDMSSTRLVYGWQLVGESIPDRGSANMLLAPTSQLATNAITELRVLTGSTDRRYTLPSACVGAGIQGRNLYAISQRYLYHADVDRQRFYGYSLPIADGTYVTSLIGLTENGRAIVACGSQVFSISLPR